MPRLQSVNLKNWKSVSEAQIELRALNVIVGANGSGKSSLLSIFKPLNSMFSRSNGFGIFIGQEGGANFSHI